MVQINILHFWTNDNELVEKREILSHPCVLYRAFFSS